jgi:23S rRNA (uracil1939-C5)-methyltransferase
VGRRQKKLSDQPFEVSVDTLNAKGLGRTTLEGKTLRVYDALPGETVMARYLFGRSQRGKAQMLEVLKASPDRVEPACPHFGLCGGCGLQHMSIDAQIARKQATLWEHLETTGQVKPQEFYPPITGHPWSYRRKARLSVRDVPAKGRVLVGFRERDGRFVADMTGCHILLPQIADALPKISEMIESLDSRRLIPQIEVACGDHQAALVFRHLEDLSDSDLQRLHTFGTETGLGIYLQSGGPDTVKLLAPENFQLQYRIDELGLNYQFEPMDFAQVNGPLNQLMVVRALELLDIQPGDHVLDLFCGLGNFTLAIAQKAAKVTGVEGSEEMVIRGTSNARLNDLDNVSFHAVDLYKAREEGDSAVPWPQERYDSIMLDPPRSGALELLSAISASTARRIVYVSCNPETLARDAGILVNQHGFQLKGAGMMDMFPHTTHSEAIALFERESPGEEH